MDMQKIKDIMNWIGTDGLLHLFACWLIVLVATPIRGIWLAILAAVVVSLAKEFWDMFVQKDNNKEQVTHDLICDGAGIVAGLLTIALWWVVIF